MKLEDAKVGMHLRDPKGNTWEILDIDTASHLPCVYVRCINFVYPVGIMTTLRIDTEAKAYVGRWMYVDKRHLIIAPDTVVQQFEGYFANGYQCINVVTGLNKTKTLRFVTKEQYDAIEVTLETLEPIPVPRHLTRENIRVGMDVRTASGMSCFVYAYTECSVHLKTNLQVLDLEGKLKQVIADLFVEWHDSSRPIPANELTTKDFIIVE